MFSNLSGKSHFCRFWYFLSCREKERQERQTDGEEKDVDVDDKLDNGAGVGDDINDGRVKVRDRVPIYYHADTIEISINNVSNQPLSSSVDGYEQNIKPTYLLIVGIKLCKKFWKQAWKDSKFHNP